MGPVSGIWEARQDARHRAHARVEDRIRCAKDTGLSHFPSRSFAINQAWLAVVMLGVDMIAWTQHLLLPAHLAKAEPKALRYRLLHVAARLTRGQRRCWLRIQRDLALGQRPRRGLCPARDPSRPGRLTSDPDTTSGGSYRQNQHAGRNTMSIFGNGTSRSVGCDHKISSWPS